jgi:hypothetical protein
VFILRVLKNTEVGSAYLKFDFNMRRDVASLHFSTFQNNKGSQWEPLLPCQVSNLNSSDPESDVLPITPQGRIREAQFWRASGKVKN